MEIDFLIIYETTVVEVDIPKLSKTYKVRVKDAIDKKLTNNPEVFGKPLRTSLKGYRRLRVGDYRVVFRIENKTVIVFAVIHKSVVYQKVAKRL